MESTGTSQFSSLKQRLKAAIEKNSANLINPHGRNVDVPARGNSDLAHMPGCNRLQTNKYINVSDIAKTQMQIGL
jgi:hypothetical protein